MQLRLQAYAEKNSLHLKYLRCDIPLTFSYRYEIFETLYAVNI